MVDETGIIIVANPTALEMFGYKEEELVGKSLEDLVPERFRGRHIDFRRGFNAHPEPRRMGTGRDLTALRKDGTEFPVEISLSFTQVNGKLLVMSFISDITKRKKAEEALRKSEEQLIVYAAELEKKVQARTEALHKTIRDLENEVYERKKAEQEAKKALERERELNDLKSKFVSIASHEFRTPLSTIMSSASLISQYNDRGDTEKIQKHVNRIKSSVNHLTSILNDFLSLGKLEEGVVDVKRETVFLREFLYEVKEELYPTLKERQQLILDVDEVSGEFCTDTRILRNILFNLVSNASKYSDAGKNIYIECRSREKDIILSIRDEGIGIPAEDQKHMFERFFRASNAGNIQGSGLGLHIVKRYAELLGGEITFTSEFGKGSTFCVSLPF